MRYIREKCDAMERSLQNHSENQSAMDSRFDDAENRQKYHEVLLKNQKWEYAVPAEVNSPGKRFLDEIITQPNLYFLLSSGRVM